MCLVAVAFHRLVSLFQRTPTNAELNPCLDQCRRLRYHRGLLLCSAYVTTCTPCCAAYASSLAAGEFSRSQWTPERQRLNFPCQLLPATCTCTRYLLPAAHQLLPDRLPWARPFGRSRRASSQGPSGLLLLAVEGPQVISASVMADGGPPPIALPVPAHPDER